MTETNNHLIEAFTDNEEVLTRAQQIQQKRKELIENNKDARNKYMQKSICNLIDIFEKAYIEDKNSVVCDLDGTFSLTAQEIDKTMNERLKQDGWDTSALHLIVFTVSGRVALNWTK